MAHTRSLRHTASAPSEAPARPLHHGGDLGRVAALCKGGDWLDLSTGINPWPYPIAPAEVPESLWARLPESALLERLRQAAARCYGAPSPEGVVAAPGSQSLIQWLPRLRPLGGVAVLSPTYGEHAAAWRATGHRVQAVTAPEALLDRRWDMVVVTNPNNPDGRRLEPAWLSMLAERLGARGGWLVLDEAFADVTPELSLAGETLRPGLIVLRSFGKFFGLSGLRLGFALTAPELATRIEAALGPWAVSGPAAWIAAHALADVEWIEATRRRLAEAAAGLDRLLSEAGLRVIGGTALYRLVETPQAHALYTSLLRHRIYVRHFPDLPARSRSGFASAKAGRPEWLRFGLPPDGQSSARLRDALAAPPIKSGLFFPTP